MYILQNCISNHSIGLLYWASTAMLEICACIEQKICTHMTWRGNDSSFWATKKTLLALIYSVCVCVVTSLLGNIKDTLVEDHCTGWLVRLLKEHSDILENVQSTIRSQIQYQFHASVSSSTETGQARTCLHEEQEATAVPSENKSFLNAIHWMSF